MVNVQRWRFGPFEVDVAEHRLLLDGQPVAVTRKAFALLVELLRRHGRLATKAELFDTVWAGTVVTDAALSRAIRELRVALGDDAAAPRYIATAHGLGFRFVASLEGEAATPSVARTDPASAGAGLVARGDELAFLDAALAAAAAGRRQVVFVTGEAGIGKTALVEAFLDRHAGGDEQWAAQGRCIEQYGTGDAFLPILEALENLTRQVGAGPLREVLARYAPTWLAQLPWLAQPGLAAVVQRTEPATSAQGMLREIAHALEVLAEQRPIVLWLEDLHWSDPSSLGVVSFIAGRREPARLLLVASFRPEDARHADSPLHGLALRLLQRGQARELALGLLDVPAVAAYLRARFGAGLAVEALAASLHRRTEGNALFIVAIADDLVRRGSLAIDGAAWRLTMDVTDLGSALPDSLRQLVHHQIENLSADDRRLVEAAAVAGADFSAAAVAAALQSDVASVEDRCALLAEQGRFLRARAPVAWPDGTVAAGFAFLHALYWHGTHERVTRSRLAEWQARIGLCEEAAYGAQAGPIAAELAMRFEQAGDIERSLRYLMMAASGALARHAYLESIELLRHALDLLPRLPAGQRPRHELDLLLPLGAALMAAQGYASSDVDATYQRALALCRVCAGPGDLERVLRGLWNVVFLRSDLERASVAAEELRVLAVGSGNPGRLFDAHAKLGQTRLHQGNFAGARAHLEHALSLAEGTDDPTRVRDSPRAAVYLAWTLWHIGLPGQALARAEEALALARRTASPHTSAFVLGYASLLHVFRGDFSRALVLARQQTALSLEHDLLYWRVMGDFIQGLVEARHGDSQRGAVAMNAAIDAMRATGAEVGVWYLHCLLAEAELDAGRPEQARAALAETESGSGSGRNGAEIDRLLGELVLAEGDGAANRQLAERRFTSALSLARRQGAHALELRAATSLARLWAGADQAVRAIELLAPVAGAFDEGADTLDVTRARALLDQLASGETGPRRVKTKR
ncbi:MAG: AAA family ATPase [Caldimonas sp.]